MRFFEMGVVFAVVGFVVANSALTLLTVALWRFVRSSRPGSRSLFLLRMLPSLGSIGVVLGVVLPSYLFFEPRRTAEHAGSAFIVFLAVACALFVAAACRTVASWRETWVVERAWRRAAGHAASLGVAVPAYRVPSDMPFAALVGIVRPRLFVSDRFLDDLSEGERRALFEHEAGHLSSLDNLKRTVMRLAPDWLPFTGTGSEIEWAWAVAAEEEADDHAAGHDRAAALDLAGALLKAVRATPVRIASASNFCEDTAITRRVERLLEDSPRSDARPTAASRSLALKIALLGAMLVAAAPALKAAYFATEATIRLLQ